MTWTADDAAMAELRSWLLEHGFIVLSDRYDADHFGNQVVELARPIAVRLVKDRDQWAIDIAGPDGVWFPLPVELPREPGARSAAPSAADRSAALRAFLSPDPPPKDDMDASDFKLGIDRDDAEPGAVAG